MLSDRFAGVRELKAHAVEQLGALFCLPEELAMSLLVVEKPAHAKAQDVQIITRLDFPQASPL